MSPAQADSAPRIRTVLLTRATADNQALRQQLVDRDFVVVELPTAALQPIVGAPLDLPTALAQVDALAFTSPHAVRFFCGAAAPPATRHGVVAWQAAGGRIGVVGAATRAALVATGLRADVEANPAHGAALAEALADALTSDASPVVAHPCAAHARPELATGLHARGVRYVPWVCYGNQAPEAQEYSLIAAAAADVVYLAAPSAADRLLAWLPSLRDAALVCIGPTTAAHLLAHHGVRAAAVAKDPSLASAVDAIVAASHLCR